MWSKILRHFTLCEFHQKVIELHFVNQVRGIPIGNHLICPTTRNEKDGKFQCLPLEPDVFKPKLPSPFRISNGINFNFDTGQLRHLEECLLNPKNKRQRSEFCGVPECVTHWKSSCQFSSKRGILAVSLWLKREINQVCLSSKLRSIQSISKINSLFPTWQVLKMCIPLISHFLQ